MNWNIEAFLRALGDAHSANEVHDIVVNHLEEAEESLARLQRALYDAMEAARDPLTSEAADAKVKS
jgi:hypothetical protein